MIDTLNQSAVHNYGPLCSAEFFCLFFKCLLVRRCCILDWHTPAQRWQDAVDVHKQLLIKNLELFLLPRPPGLFPAQEGSTPQFCFFLEKSPQLTSGHAPAWSVRLNQPVSLQSFQTLNDRSVGNTCQGRCQKLQEKIQSCRWWFKLNLSP